MATRRHAEMVTVARPGYGTSPEVSALGIEPPPWTVDALCAETDPESFFPEKGGSTREAKDICTRCPVQVECLDYALGNNEGYGIWGGVSERDRRKLMRGSPRPDASLDTDLEIA
jgi:WhiB family transcriptional regulator, redox-sensing transcriptional regulator